LRPSSSYAPASVTCGGRQSQEPKTPSAIRQAGAPFREITEPGRGRRGFGAAGRGRLRFFKRLGRHGLPAPDRPIPALQKLSARKPDSYKADQSSKAVNPMGRATRAGESGKDAARVRSPRRFGSRRGRPVAERCGLVTNSGFDVCFCRAARRTASATSRQRLLPFRQGRRKRPRLTPLNAFHMARPTADDGARSSAGVALDAD